MLLVCKGKGRMHRTSTWANAVTQRLSSAAPPLLPQLSSRGLDWEAFRTDGHALIDAIADRHTALAGPLQTTRLGPQVGDTSRPRGGSAVKKFKAQLNTGHASSFTDVVRDVDDAIGKGMVDWQHKGFLSFFPAQVSPAAALGELLALSYNHPGFAWATCPVSTELEPAVTDAVAAALGLSKAFLWDGKRGGGGTIQPSATEGFMVALLTAKACALDRAVHREYAGEQMRSTYARRLVVYYSDQAHFSIDKACKVLEIEHCRRLQTTLNVETGNYSLNAEDVEAKMVEDIACGLIPFMVVGTVGTTATCAVDPIAKLGQLCRNTGAWLHVDAAYAGAAALCSEYRSAVMDGVELFADSLSVNGSKWMLMSVGCSFLFVRNVALVQHVLSSGGSYVPVVAGTRDLKDLGLGMGRPWLGLKVYAVLRCVGVDTMANAIRRHVLLAQYLDTKLRTHGAFDGVVAPPQFGLVVFRVRMFSDEDNRTLQRRLMETRNMFIGSAVICNRVVLRISLAHAKLEVSDVDAMYAAIASEHAAMESEATQ